MQPAKIKIGLLFVFLFGLLPACNKNFDNINKSPDFVSTPNLDYELSAAQVFMLDQTYYTVVPYVASIVGQVTQQQTYLKATAINSDKNGGFHFTWIYQNPMKAAQDIITHTQGDDSKVNYLSMARIIRAYCAHALTDVYGDIPYSEANKGYTDQVLTPAYDAQQDIYADMLNELQEAAAAFDQSKSIPATADIVYKGSLDKWKRFAYGLMLRLGLRIMKADPQNGQKWINAAIAGGLPTSNEDNFVVNYLPSTTKNSSSNPTGNDLPWTFIKYPTIYRLSEPFVDSLKSRNDPRTKVYCMLPGDPANYVFGDTTPVNQKGYPMFGVAAGQSAVNFSVSNIQTFGRFDAPFVHLSYAQSQFQLAECVVRGFIPAAISAQTYYENGVRAAMTELSIFNPAYAISDDKINAYLQQNPYNPGDALNQINTQYWIETHYNWYENWANVRRSGYPDLYSGFTDGSTLPRRFPYPSTEAAANPHVQDAVKRQGPDLNTTRIWWDKQ